jgi:pectin methylesterase-like acyl-CoA thioesterase
VSSDASIDTTSFELGANAASSETIQSSFASQSSETSDTFTSSEISQSSEASLSLTEFPSSSTFASSDPTTTSESVVPTSTDSPLVLTVAADGSGDYTAINDAIKAAQTSGYPTVTVLAGTYTENIVIAATPTVTIVGEASRKRDGASGVVIDNGANADPALSFSTDAAAGITWENIKFFNSLADNSAGAVFLRGSKNAFYNCQFVSAGIAAITGSYASAIIANSYLEAQSKVIYNYPSLYLYGTTITATQSNALIVYNKGATSGSTLYNSTIVFDTCEVVKKSGATNTRVFLAAGNGDGSVAVFRDTSFASGFLAASGVYLDSKTQSPLNSYVEFGTTGDVTDRSKYVTLVTDPKDLSPYEISAFFKSAYPSVAVSSVDWVDSSVLSAIKASNAKDSKDADPTSTIASSTGSDSLTTTGASSTTASIASTTEEESMTSAAPTQSSCALPSSVPSTALVVGPESNPCASFNTIASAIAALPKDDTSQYIYILAGTYKEKVTIQRVGATVVRGQSSDGSSAKNNKVTITASSGVLSSNGGSSGTATFSTSQYEAKLVSFYNINFENAFEAATNNVALAVYAKGTKVAFYGCDINSSQGTLYIDYGNVFISHSILRGTTDFLWGQGAGYVYNSVIVSKGTATGQAIAAHKFQGQYGGSRFVFDLCAVVPEANTVPEGSTFLGRDYSTKSNVAFVNSFIDAHISPSGWKISYPSTFAGAFTEGNNTGPGWDSSSRVSAATIVEDTSSFSAASILGGDAWIDKAAIAPFQGWPESKYGKEAATTSASATATASATSSATDVGATLTVAPSPTGDQYKTVASALAAIPDDGEDYTVFIKAGSYNEQLNLNRGRGRVTLRGETTFENDFTQNQVLIWFKLGYGTGESRNEETPVLFWKTTTSTAGLSLYNLNFTNTYPQTRDTAALAADFFGNNMAAYGCAFSGFQDTLLVNQGVQVFSNSYLEGSVDFIWGYSKAYFHQCYIASNTPNAYITAQNRKSSSWAGGFIFDTCKVTYTNSYGSSFGTTSLGRPWSQYALVVYMNSFLDKHISPAGWSTWSSSNPQTSVSIQLIAPRRFDNVGPRPKDFHKIWSKSLGIATHIIRLRVPPTAFWKHTND